MDLHAAADLRLLPPLLAAVVLGGALGWEREARGKVAGLRTHILVALSSALFVLLGQIAPAVAEETTSDVSMDPVRIIQAVVIGIGFIGSGVVRAAKDEDRADGLTTAASIWATAAMGLAVGFRHYALGVIVTILSVGVMRILGWAERSIRPPA